MGIKKTAVYGILSAAAIAFAVYSPEIGRCSGRLYLAHKKAEKERLEKHGFKVIPFPCEYQGGGNTFCLMNAL